MKKLLERIVDTFWYNFGFVPEKEFYIEDHVERGECRVVEKLFRDNPGLQNHRDMFGNPLLILAANEGRLEMCGLLLSLGCDVNAVDATGATALHHAVDNSDLEIVSLLISHGASSRISDENGCVPLDWAKDAHKSNLQRIFASGNRPN